MTMTTAPRLPRRRTGATGSGATRGSTLGLRPTEPPDRQRRRVGGGDAPRWPLVLLAVVAMAGCTAAEHPRPPIGRATQRVTAAAGLSLNDIHIEGETLQAVSIASARLAGVRLTGVHLVGTVFVGLAGDAYVHGRDFIGAELEGTLTNGAPVTLRIDEISAVPVRGELYFYQVSVKTTGGWRPLCQDPNSSVPVEGSWDMREGVPGGGARIADPGVVSFSCRTGAISRCMELGYTPWRQGTTPDGAVVSGDALLQACTRMMRADYCGDGRSWTVHGVLVNVYDGVGIQADTVAWPAEAEWTGDGALCIAERRVAFRGIDPPPCAQPRPHPLGSCLDKAHFGTGTLLMNELTVTLEQ